MKTKIPDALKTEQPPTKWGKLLIATPVVLTVIATMLAGLASSEMTKAQYDRSLAAQLQSKAGDQWGYFQAKKLRGALQQNTLDLLQAAVDTHPFSTAALKDQNEATLAALDKGEVPPVPAVVFSENIKAALAAVEASKSDEEINATLANVKAEELAAALAAAKQAAIDFDTATKPVNQALDRLNKSYAAGDKNQFHDFSAARMRYLAARYDAEARLNQTVANIYELEVRKNNVSAERHHRRSGRFFYGMLAAQMGVIVATFALAARKKNLLWSFAAAAGLIAVSFSAYVYLRM